MHIMREPYPSLRGFSLLELLVVLVIVGLMATLVGVSISRSLSAAEVRSASRDLMAAMRYTRGQAILKRSEQTLAVDVEKRQYQAPGRGVVELPEGMDMRLLTARTERTGDTTGTIRFYPDGSSTGGRVTLVAGEREWEINVAWLTGEVTRQEVEP